MQTSLATDPGLSTTKADPQHPKDAKDRKATESRSTSPHKAWRIAFHTSWIVVLALATAARMGRFGFHPSDPGFILAQSWRILHGEIPHTDIISARPLGSAVLHIVDFALPAPLFVASSFVSMLELTIATVALAVLITRRPVLTWGPGLTCLVAAAALINLNVFPAMAWHTIDGIALTACGAWALDAGLRSGRALPRRVGLFLLGFAAFVKQGFLLAAIIGFCWLLLHPSTREGALRTARWWRRTVADLVALGAFPLIYVAVVVVSGGFSAMVNQVTGGQAVYGRQLLLLWLDRPMPLDEPPLRNLALFGGLALLLMLVRALAQYLRALPDWVNWLAEWLLVAAGTAAVAWTLIESEFNAPNRWADVLWWMCAGAVVVNAVKLKRVPWVALLILTMSFMISLSWGQDTPTLLAGTLSLTTIVLLAQGSTPLRSLTTGLAPRLTTALSTGRLRAPRLVVGGAVGLVVLVISGLTVIEYHDRRPYSDLSQGYLTKDLGDVTPAMSGIRTNPTTHAYIAQIPQCTHSYPAGRVAVLPDNAFAYPAFTLRNPFPLEWPMPLEFVADTRERMLATADRLNAEGDYLVLFQTMRSDRLILESSVPTQVASDTQIYDYPGGIARDINQRLTGQTITCGNFVGKWAPKP